MVVLSPDVELQPETEHQAQHFLIYSDSVSDAWCDPEPIRCLEKEGKEDPCGELDLLSHTGNYGRQKTEKIQTKLTFTI